MSESKSADESAYRAADSVMRAIPIQDGDTSYTIAVRNAEIWRVVDAALAAYKKAVSDE